MNPGTNLPGARAFSAVPPVWIANPNCGKARERESTCLVFGERGGNRKEKKWTISSLRCRGLGQRWLAGESAGVPPEGCASEAAASEFHSGGGLCTPGPPAPQQGCGRPCCEREVRSFCPRSLPPPPALRFLASRAFLRPGEKAEPQPGFKSFSSEEMRACLGSREVRTQPCGKLRLSLGLRTCGRRAGL